MLFFHEEIIQRKKRFEESMKDFKQTESQYNLKYDIYTDLKLCEEVAAIYDFNYLSIHLANTCTKKQFNDLLDYIEETYLPDWELHPDQSKFIHGEYRFCYTKKKNLNIWLYFHPVSCKLVKTGRKIDEYKTICEW